MNCLYTAQGEIVCRSKAAPIVESFFVREDPNEPDANYACAPIQKSFAAIAASNGCDINTDVESCTLDFNCNNGNCSAIHKKFTEIALANECNVKTNLKNCQFSYECRPPTK